MCLEVTTPVCPNIGESIAYQNGFQTALFCVSTACRCSSMSRLSGVRNIYESFQEEKGLLSFHLKLQNNFLGLSGGPICCGPLKGRAG